MATTTGYCSCGSNGGDGGGEDDSKGSGGKNGGNNTGGGVKSGVIAAAMVVARPTARAAAMAMEWVGAMLVAKVRATLVATGAPRAAAGARATRCRGLQWHT